MNKILYFEVKNADGYTRRIDADAFRMNGEYVEFFETVPGTAPTGGISQAELVATLPTRSLLTMVHRPREVTPIYEEEK